MKTVSVEGFISLNTNDWAGENAYSFNRFEMRGDGYVNVMPYTFEFTLPEGFDPRAELVEALKADKVKLMAEFQNRVTEIERKISELTAIEYAS